MSYTSSDPENLSCDFDPNSNAAAQPAKPKKKPWSKFKSSIKSIGDKMSSSPKFTEHQEGGEQKRTKKNKKTKTVSDEVKNPKVSPGSSNVKIPSEASVKVVPISESTSESNISTSDLDSPRKVLTAESLGTPDSGRASQDIEGKGDASSDFSVDSGITLGQKHKEKSQLEGGKYKDLSEQFIAAETKSNIPDEDSTTVAKDEIQYTSQKNEHKTSFGAENKDSEKHISNKKSSIATENIVQEEDNKLLLNEEEEKINNKTIGSFSKSHTSDCSSTEVKTTGEKLEENPKISSEDKTLLVTDENNEESAITSDDKANNDPLTITDKYQANAPNKEGVNENKSSEDKLAASEGLQDSVTNKEDIKMTVEDKLASILTSEGWPGSIKNKDIAVEAGSVGMETDKLECLFKILVIGELGAGKTSIIKRYVHEFFSPHYRATIGVDFALKVITWNPNSIIRLQLWDIAGQERFGNMTRVYYKDAVGAFIVFDVTRSTTFDAVIKWKQDLDSKVQLADGSPIPCVLLANKCDQQKEGIINTPNKIDEYCQENNFFTWFETSAKENINIEEAAKSLVTEILRVNDMRPGPETSGGISLLGTSEQEKKSCSC